MSPVDRRLLSRLLFRRRAAAGSSSPNTAPLPRKGIRYSIAASPHFAFAAVVAKPITVSADAGYWSAANVTDESVAGVDPHLATGRQSFGTLENRPYFIRPK